MVFPIVTATYAAILGLILVALSAWVVAYRLQSGVLHGDGGQEGLNRRSRAHANFIEYVPLILLLIALLESTGANRTLINILLLVLVIARVMHPFGMLARLNSPQQYICRGGAASATLIVMAIASLMLLLRCIAGMPIP